MRNVRAQIVSTFNSGAIKLFTSFGLSQLSDGSRGTDRGSLTRPHVAALTAIAATPLARRRSYDRMIPSRAVDTAQLHPRANLLADDFRRMCSSFFCLLSLQAS